MKKALSIISLFVLVVLGLVAGSIGARAQRNSTMKALFNLSYTVPTVNITLNADGGQFENSASTSQFSLTCNGTDIDLYPRTEDGIRSYIMTLETISTYPEPTRDGYTFDYWKYNNEVVTNSSEIPFNNNITLTAHWRANEYTLTAYANEGIISDTEGWTGTGNSATKSVTYNGTYGTFPSVSRTGYTLKGWYTASSEGTKVEITTTYTTIGASAIYAQWTPITYTISYDGNGATDGSTEESSHTYDIDKNLTSNGFSKTGHTFAGWAESDSGSVVYSDGQSVSNLTTTNGDTVTLYAKWNVNTYTVTIASNNTSYGTVSPTSVANVPYGTVITTSNNTVNINGTTVTATSKTNYKFNNWANGDATVTGALTVTANFVKTSVSVTFNGNGGTLTCTTCDGDGKTNEAQCSRCNGRGYTIEYEDCSSCGGSGREVYSCSSCGGNGYVMEEQGSQGYVNVKCSSCGGSGTRTRSCTSCGGDGENSYHEDCSRCGGDGETHSNCSTCSSSGKVSSLTATKSTGTKSWSQSINSRTGHTFNGWYSAASGGTQYANSSGNGVEELTEDITLYAQWAVNTYNISYTMNGGTHSGDFATSYTFSTSSQTVNIGSFSRTDYNLSSVSISPDGPTRSGTKLTIPENFTGNITLTCNWKKPSSGCLAYDTPILLADGTTKMVQDITYKDRILTFNHDTGEIMPTYLVWIGQSGVSHNYIRLTFNDGSYLNLVGDHSIYNLDQNRYVSILDRENLNIGTRVVQVDYNEGNPIWREVTISDIQIIYEEIEYVHNIIATNYWNVITGGILTNTNKDAAIAHQNRFGFNEDLTYSDTETRKQLLEGTYDGGWSVEEFISIFGSDYNYTYGGHLVDFKILIDKGLVNKKSIAEFIWYAKNKEIYASVPLTDLDGDNIWPVTTEFDVWQEGYDVNDHMMKEGSTYILPECEVEGFAGWYCMVDNKVYSAGDEYIVRVGTHFVAVFE